MNFKLEAVLKESRYKSALSTDIQRGVERLIWKGDQQAAYELYSTDEEVERLAYDSFCEKFPTDPPNFQVL
jgi:hypothetical protein